MKKVVTLLLFFSMLTYGQSSERVVLDLPKAISYALENNSTIKIAKLDVAKAEEKLKETRGNFFPQIDASGQYQRYINKPVLFLPPGSPMTLAFGGRNTIEIGADNSYTGGISASLPLFSLSLIQGTGLASIGIDLSEANYTLTKAKTISDVQKAYLSVLVAREYQSVMMQSLKNAEENLGRVRNLNKRGLLSNYDLLRAEVQVENLKPLVLQAENNYKLAIDGLKVTVGFDPSVDVEVTGTLEYDEHAAAPSVDEAMRDALKNNPQLCLLDKQVELSAKSLSLEKAAYAPTLAAFGSYQYQTQANDYKFKDYQWVRTSLVGLQLQVPLFHGFKTQAKVEQAYITYSQAEEQREGYLKALKTQVQSAVYRIEQAIIRVEAQSKAVKQAEEGYTIAKSRFENGIATQLELNDAELALRQAKLNRLQAIYDYTIAKADLGVLTGKIVTMEMN